MKCATFLELSQKDNQITFIIHEVNQAGTIFLFHHHFVDGTPITSPRILKVERDCIFGCLFRDVDHNDTISDLYFGHLQR